MLEETHKSNLEKKIKIEKELDKALDGGEKFKIILFGDEQEIRGIEIIINRKY